MAKKRQSQGGLVESANEAVALARFQEAIATLPDPRRKQGLRYPLASVVVTALMAAVCGAEDAEAMQWWGELNEELLRELVELPHGPPTQDVFLAVFAALDPRAFGDVFRAWVDLLQVRLDGAQRHLAVDGKTSRRSHDRAAGRPAIHTLCAWMADTGIVVGQLKTGERSNEITALHELLPLLDLRGSTVSIDAMGCQTDIAAKITEARNLSTTLRHLFS